MHSFHIPAPSKPVAISVLAMVLSVLAWGPGAVPSLISAALAVIAVPTMLYASFLSHAHSLERARA